MSISREDFSVIDTGEETKRVSELCGWSPRLARESFSTIRSQIPQLKIWGAVGDLPKRTMLYELTRKVLGKDTDNYPQLIGDCYVSGTKVLMANGQEKDIEKILIGDEVLNHEGKPAKVTDIVAKLYTGDMVTIKVKGHNRKLTATATHDSLTLPYHQYRYKFNGFGKGKFGDYEEQDRVLIPYGLQSSEDITIDVKDHMSELEGHTFDDNYVYDKKFNKINRFIKVDNKFARFIGLYLAEGGTDCNITYFCFNSNELMYIKEVEVLAEEIFGELIIKNYTPGSNCIRVAIRSRLVTSFIKSFVPGKISTKTIPDIFFRVSKSIKLDILRGWLDGDGHKNFKQNSANLGIDMQRIALSCGINARSMTRMRKVRAKFPVTEIGMYSAEPYKIYHDQPDNSRLKPVKCNDNPYGFARPITTVEKEYVENKAVFCITTDGIKTIVVNGIGSYNCTSFMGKNCSEYVQIYPISQDQRNVFTKIFPSYIYGTERVLIGGQGGSYSDGGVGAWVAEAVQKYGVISSDAPNCPKYSAGVAKDWGANGPPDQFITLGKQHIIKSAAAVTTIADAKLALSNYYPVGVCSSIGFDMLAQADGFHHYTTTWNHAMTFIGYDEGDPSKNIPACFCLLNNWGDVHGTIVDFRTNEKWPVGTLRISEANVQRMLDAQDSYAFSALDSFQVQKLPRDIFVLF